MAEFKKTGDLNKMLRSGADAILIDVQHLHTGTMVSSRGQTYLAVSLEYSEVGSEEVKIRTRPVFSKEGRLIVNNGPYLPSREYVVIRGIEKGFPAWKTISPNLSKTDA